MRTRFCWIHPQSITAHCTEYQGKASLAQQKEGPAALEERTLNNHPSRIYDHIVDLLYLKTFCIKLSRDSLQYMNSAQRGFSKA